MEAWRAHKQGAIVRRVSPRIALLGLVAIFVALSLYTTLTSRSGVYVPDSRLEHVLAPGQDLARQAYAWDDERSLGTPISPFYVTPATSVFETAVDKLGAPPWVIERLTHALYYSLAAIGVLLLMWALRPRVGLEHAAAAFVYTFNPFTAQYLLPSTLFLYYCLAPWFAWIALRGVRGDDPWRWAAAFALAITVPGAVNGAALGYALIPAALAAVYFGLVEGRYLGRLWRWVWRAMFLSVPTTAATIVVLALSGSQASSALQMTELPADVARSSSWSESWRGLGFWLTYYPGGTGHLFRQAATSYFTDPLVIAATFLAPLVALITLAISRWRHRLLFGSIAFLCLVLMVGIYTGGGRSPFGRLLSFAFDHSNLALGFRTTHKAGPGLMLGIAVLLGIGLSAAVAAIARGVPESRRPRDDRTRLLLGIGLTVLVTAGVVIASFPFWTRGLYPDSGYRRIPGYWHRTFDYLGAQRQPSRVLVLPGAEEARYRWGDVHDSLFDALSPATPVTSRALQQGTPESADLVSAIDEYVSSPSYIPGSLAPILRRLGVQWVVLQNDLDWGAMDVPRPSTYDALRADPGLRPAAAFGRRGEYTTNRNDLFAISLGERALPPVQVYEVRGAPGPEPRLAHGSPLLVEGAGDSWPALASSGLLNGPPVAYTGAAQDSDLRQMVGSGSQVVVTDGNRRRSILASIGRPSISPTLAPGEPHRRPAFDLFGNSDTQSYVTFADADWITATRFGFPLSFSEDNSDRPASAFDGVERTAWTVRGPLSPDGESIAARLRRPTTIDAVSVLPQSDGPWHIAEVEAIAHSEDGSVTTKMLRFNGALSRRARVRLDTSGVTELELRIAKVDGPGPVGLAGVGIAEVGVTTPSGPLDLREFVKTPTDLADRARSDPNLAAALAHRPPRYELRRVTGIGPRDEETEMRREIATFGTHRYRLGATARIDTRSADSAIDALLGGTVGAIGTSRFGGDPDGRGDLAVDDDLSTGWEPNPLEGERLDLHFPDTSVRTVEVLSASGPVGGLARSRVTKFDIDVGGQKRSSSHLVLPGGGHCLPESPPLGCLERHTVEVRPTRTDHLSVSLAGLTPVIGPFGELPPRVVEVRINGGDWSGITASAAPETCAPLVAIDGQPIPVRLPSDPGAVTGGRLMTLRGCSSVRLGPGEHRIETLPGLSGAVRTASLVPVGAARPPVEGTPAGKVQLVGHSQTRLALKVHAPKGALLVGGMPADPSWTSDDANLRRAPVPLDTFAAWRVEAPTAGPVTLSFDPQRIYELAMALSIAASAWCLWRITRRRGTPR